MNIITCEKCGFRFEQPMHCTVPVQCPNCFPPGKYEVYSEDEEITKPCSRCSKKMIRGFTCTTFTTFPLNDHWKWYCGCGNSEDGGSEVRRIDQEGLYKKWKKANED